MILVILILNRWQVYATCICACHSISSRGFPKRVDEWIFNWKSCEEFGRLIERPWKSWIHSSKLFRTRLRTTIISAVARSLIVFVCVCVCQNIDSDRLLLELVDIYLPALLMSINIFSHSFKRTDFSIAND